MNKLNSVKIHGGQSGFYSPVKGQIAFAFKGIERFRVNADGLLCRFLLWLALKCKMKGGIYDISKT